MGKQWFEVRDMDRFLRDHPGAIIVRVEREIGFVLVDVPPNQLSAMALHPCVKRTHPYELKRPFILPFSFQGPQETLDEVLLQIRAKQVHDQGFLGRGVLLAAGDTGIDTTHPDLRGFAMEARDFTISRNTRDIIGHGTTVSHEILTVAPKARLFFGKVFADNQPGASDEDIMEFLDECVRQKVRVANLSLGSNYPSDGNDPLSRKVDSVVKKGVLVIMANGNNGNWSPTGSPAASRLGMSVGAVDKFDKLASFSTDGPTADGRKKPEAYAPGVNIVMARARGTTMGEIVDENHIAAPGTSFSAPPTTGLAGLMLQANPKLTPAELKDIIVRGEDPIGR